jgi:hypothetical protein
MKCGPAVYLVVAGNQHPDEGMFVCGEHLFTAIITSMGRAGEVEVTNLDPGRGLFCELDDYSEQDDPEYPDPFARYDRHNEPTSSAEIYQMFEQHEQVWYHSLGRHLAGGDQT